MRNRHWIIIYGFYIHKTFEVLSFRSGQKHTTEITRSSTKLFISSGYSHVWARILAKQLQLGVHQLLYELNITVWVRLVAIGFIMLLLFLLFLFTTFIPSLITFFGSSIQILEKRTYIQSSHYLTEIKSYREKCMFNWFLGAKVNFEFRHLLRFLKKETFK